MDHAVLMGNRKVYIDFPSCIAAAWLFSVMQGAGIEKCHLQKNTQHGTDQTYPVHSTQNLDYLIRVDRRERVCWQFTSGCWDLCELQTQRKYREYMKRLTMSVVSETSCSEIWSSLIPPHRIWQLLSRTICNSALYWGHLGLTLAAQSPSCTNGACQSGT